MKNFIKIVAFATLVLSLHSTPGFAEWQVFGDLPIPVASGEAVTLDGKIYIFGGYADSSNVPIGAIQEFDPRARKGGQWRLVGRMAMPRSNFVARVYKDRVFIVGGETGLEQASVNSMEMWLPDKGSTLLDENTWLNRIGASGEIWNDIFIIIGGYYARGVDSSPFSAIGFDILERKQRFFIPLPPGLVPYNHASVLLHNSIYVIGGVRQGVSKRIYKFGAMDKNIGRIQPDLFVPRASFEAVTFSKDAAWFIGGYNEDNPALASTSRFIIAGSVRNKTYSLEKAPRLNIGRRELMAAMAGDSIYVFGGRNNHDEVVASCEKTSFPSSETGVEEKIIAQTFLLKQNYPNPFNPATTIAFGLAAAQQVRLDIFAANGSLIKTLLDATVGPGEHSVLWNGTNADGVPVASGVYFYKLTTESNVEMRKMLLVK